MDSRKISRFFVYFFLTVGALIMLLPFFWMFSSAFKTTQEINRFPPQWLPSHLSLDNFKRAFEMAPFARYFINSIIVMVVSVSITTFTTILAAFAFSRLRFPGRNLIFSLLLSLMMIPFEMLIITNYTTVVNLKIYDTLYALILPFTSSIFYTYILKNFFDSIQTVCIGPLASTVRATAFSVEGHGADGASVADDDCAAQRSGKLELVHVADVCHRQQGKPHAAVGFAGFYDGSRFVSRIADGCLFGRCVSGRHFVSVRPQIHCSRRGARRFERLNPIRRFSL